MTALAKCTLLAATYLGLQNKENPFFIFHDNSIKIRRIKFYGQKFCKIYVRLLTMTELNNSRKSYFCISKFKKTKPTRHNVRIYVLQYLGTLRASPGLYRDYFVFNCFVGCKWMTTLTEVFPCFFLSCKTNARVKPAKTGHGPHSSKFFLLLYVFFVLLYAFFVLFYVMYVLWRSLYCLCVYMYWTTATGWLPNCS
jgi:hypothetical protein